MAVACSVLVEGYATGASVHEATGHMVLVCIVLKRPAQRGAPTAERDFPRPSLWWLPITICGTPVLTARPYNPGMAAAQKVAAEVQALVCRAPVLQIRRSRHGCEGQTHWADGLE